MPEPADSIPLPAIIHVVQEHQVREYTVRSGDTLAGIAGSHCGNTADWTGIWKANEKTIGTNPDLIYPGEHLVLDCSQAHVRQRHYAPVIVTNHVTGTYHGSGAMQQCIISRESGGNPDVWNASGHWGLYQFSESTWIAHGGSAADFGHASVAEQNQIYYNTVAQDGYSDWAPYDGC